MFLFPRNQCDCESLCAGNSLCTAYTWFDKEDPGEMVIIIISISITKNSCSSFVFLQLFYPGEMVITIIIIIITIIITIFDQIFLKIYPYSSGPALPFVLNL